MTNSRQKGAAGERELAKVLRSMGFGDCRRGQQFCGSPDSPDVQGIPGLHIEAKRTERLNIYAAMAQSIADAGSNVPTVCHRRNRGEWLVTLRLEDLVRLGEIVGAAAGSPAQG